MPGAKNFTVEDKRVAIGLWKGGLPLSKIREQLQMSKASLKRSLATARKNPTLPVAKRKVGTGRKSTINQEILRLMRKKLVKDPTLSAKQLRACIPGLQLEITRLWVTRMENSDYLRSLVESMPRRLQEVISKAGNTTKY